MELTDGQWGVLVEGNCTGAIGMLQREQVNLIIDTMLQDKERVKVTKFLSTMWTTRHIMVSHITGKESMLIFLNPDIQSHSMDYSVGQSGNLSDDTYAHCQGGAKYLQCFKDFCFGLLIHCSCSMWYQLEVFYL